LASCNETESLWTDGAGLNKVDFMEKNAKHFFTKVVNWRAAQIMVFGFLLVFANGCFLLPGDPSAHIEVVLQLPATSQNGVHFTGSELEVQEALRIVDVVRATDGISRDPNPPAANEQHVIAEYNVVHATGQKMVFAGPTVSLEGDRLYFSFDEFGKRHPSPRVENTCLAIADELKRHFGEQRVKIEY
jgi:hypothetical protein